MSRVLHLNIWREINFVDFSSLKQPFEDLSKYKLKLFSEVICSYEKINELRTLHFILSSNTSCHWSLSISPENRKLDILLNI